MFDVVEIVLNFFEVVFDGAGVGESDLCPAGEAGFGEVAEGVEGHLFF